MELNLKTSSEKCEEEKETRRKRSKNIYSFGVRYLDVAIGGIFKNDLIIIGAPPGTGKTELVTHIASQSAQDGCRVVLFALEAENCEIESRIKFKIAKNLYYDDNSLSKKKMSNISYRRWYMNLLPFDFEKYEEKAEIIFKEKLKNLTTFYREENFNVNDFQKILLAVKENFDLVIIDHLNYFDTEGKNENREVSDIVKKIRDLALLTGLPIILVAHLKKPDKRFRSIVPELDDFHGTSDIGKVATKAIIIAPDYSVLNPMKLGTFFRIAKFRVDGSPTRYIARCDFNIETNSYEHHFDLGHLSEDGKEFKPIDVEKIPLWAK